MSLNAGARIGSYSIVTALGAGGMGEVYRARDGKLDRDVALKILPESFAADPDRLMRFTREAKTLASLNHPNIAAIYGIEDRALVMELVEGEDLSVHIGRGAIPVDEALPIARQIAQALEAAHELGIIHRDLKPANIKVRTDGTVKVLDFGLAKALDPAVASDPQVTQSPTFTSPALTQMGVILGTAAYMAPEQARGKAVDRRADVWAYGVVLYEMLTGRRCFGGSEMPDVLAAVLRQPIDWTALPPETPPSVRRLLRRCLERDRAARLGDMSAVRIEIDEALGPGEAPAESPGRTRLPWFHIAAALALVTLALAVTLTLLLRGPSGIAIEPPVVRFALVDDPKFQVHVQSTQPLAVSGDGRTIVFSADAGAGPQLWVRTIDQPEPRPLADTEGAHQPALSPDGEWVAFVVSNHIIRKVRLAGGGASTMAALDDVTAALAWSSDDEIVFEKIGSAAGIHRVSANGGSPEVLIPLDAAVNERGHRRPVVLHDARVVMYTSSTPGNPSTLAAFSLADGRQARLTLEGVQALGMIEGHLVYSRQDGSLMAIPFDARAMRTTGPPRQLPERVLATPFGTSVALSGSGTLVSASPTSPTSRLMIGDSTGKAQTVGNVARAFDSPRFSPEGRRIGVSIADGANEDLWVIDRASGAATRLTRGGQGRVALQGWTRDGRSLVYLRDNRLLIAPIDGATEPRPFLAIEGRLTGASFVPDGRAIVVTRRLEASNGMVDREEIALVPTTGNAAPAVLLQSKTSGGTMRPELPRVSPDGRWVAFQDRNERQIHVRSLDGSASVQVSDAGGDLPVWAHDSRRVFYATSDGLVAADLQVSPSLAVLRRERMSSFPSAAVHDVSPDGAAFLLVAPVERASRVFVAVNWAADVRRQLRVAGGPR